MARETAFTYKIGASQRMSNTGAGSAGGNMLCRDRNAFKNSLQTLAQIQLEYLFQCSLGLVA